MEIKVEGLSETLEMLDKAGKTIVARGYLRAAQAAANVIADAVEERTPIEAEDTGGILDRGELRESLMVDIQLDSQFRGVTADIGFGNNGSVALWLEYGHHMVGHKPAKKPLGEARAIPFMRPAADAAAEAAIDAFAESLKATVAEEFQGRR